MCHYLGTVLVTPHLRGPRHLSHDGQQNVGGGHVGGGLTGWHCPDAPGEPLQHELPVHHRGQQAGLRLGGEGPEAELGGADEEVEDGQHRVIHHLALRTPPPPQSNLPIAPLLGHESGKLILLHRIVTRKILNTICNSATMTVKCRSMASCWQVMGLLDGGLGAEGDDGFS